MTIMPLIVTLNNQFNSTQPSVCFWGPMGETRWPHWPLIGWDISTSSLKPLTGIQRNLIGSKISTYSTKFMFLGQSENQDGGPGLWLAETFWTSPLKPLKWIKWNLTGSKISRSSTKFVFLGPIGQTRCPPPGQIRKKKVAHCTQVHDIWSFGPLV